MKFTTRWILAISITVLTITTLVIYKDLFMFASTTYPLIAGWAIGECLNIPEQKLKTKWRSFKRRCQNYKDKILIIIFNSLNKEEGDH